MPAPANVQSKDRAYVVATAWPAGADHATVAAGLVRACAIEESAAVRAATRPTPLIVRRIETKLADRAVSNLRTLGFAAIWLSISELANRVPSIPAKRITPAIGAPVPMFLVECWPPHESMGLLGSSIRMLVRGRTRQTKVTQSDPTLPRYGSTALDDLGWGTASAPDESVAARRTTSYNEVLDIHLDDDRALRCNASRFHFADLGAPKCYSDADNVDRLATHLAQEAPQALIDTQFVHRACPAEVLIDLRATTSGTGETRSPAAFNAYSAWAASLASRGIAW